MKPLLYRSGPKWPLIIAFAAAAAIHVSALAFSPLHHPPLPGPGDSTEITMETPPTDPEPSPEPEETLPPTFTPPPAASNEFSETPQPTPRHLIRAARPIHSDAARYAAQPAVGNGKVFALNAPRPDYPYEARAHHITGSGAVMLDVDPVSGAVLNATTIQSTGSPI